MAHIEQQNFCKQIKEQYPDFFKNKKVLDIGSLDINGNNTVLFEDSDYIGIDVDFGDNVDVASIGHLYDAPDDYFDVIISTETFEHDMFYEMTIANVIRMLKPGGLFLFTCAAPGRPEHGTKKTGSQFDAPLLNKISDEWGDYYKNLLPADFTSIPLFMKTFPDGYFEIKDTEINVPSDLYFYGFKGGDRNDGHFEIYLDVNGKGGLFLHVKGDVGDLIEVDYGDYKKFHAIEKDGHLTELLGEYRKGTWVKVYNEGQEVYKEFLGGNPHAITNPITEKIIKPENQRRNVNFHFVNGPFVEITENGKHKYNVRLDNTNTNENEYEKTINSNNYVTGHRKYYVDWNIKIKGIDTDFDFEHKFNPKGQRILIGFESKSLGDTLAWIPYVEKFANEKECDVICSTFFNNLIKKQYPTIKFVNPGTTVHNIYASYSIGLFFDEEKPTEFDGYRNPTDARNEPLGKIASDILGLEYEEIKPRLQKFNVKKKKQVVIANHSTAQCKYWNNPTGWQEVVDYLKSKDYNVIILSREEDGYMGNKNPRGAVKHKKGSLVSVIKTIQESEMFIGISGGLSWVSWATGTPTILISGFTDTISEPQKDIHRVINRDVCNGCWGEYKFDAGNWNWCPRHEGTDKQFECSKSITSKMVIKEIDDILK